MHSSVHQVGDTTYQRIMSFRHCTDGGRTLRDSGLQNRAGDKEMHKAEILEGSYWRSERVRCPLRLGYVGQAGSELLDAIDSLKSPRPASIPFRLEETHGSASLDGLQVAKLILSAEKVRITYWIDLARGAIPLRTSISFGPSSGMIEWNCGDIREVRPGAWFPYYEARIAHDVNGKLGNVTAFVVNEANFKDRPDSRVLMTLAYPAPVVCYDLVKNLRYPKRDSWQLDNLPGPTDSGVRALQLKPAPRTAAPTLAGARKPGANWWPLVFFLLGVLLITLGIRKGLRNRSVSNLER